MRSSSSQNRSEPGGADSPTREAGDAFPEGFPRVFGKYVLVRPMAKGGMGELFIAAAGETGGFEKLCVVKKVLRSIDDAAVHRRFLDEAKVVVRLNHANLVQVFDAGRVDNEYYLTMELVEGKDLRAVWNRCAKLHRRIPVDIAIFVTREVLRGLEYVHDAMALELVHRDISPPNLLVGYRGDVKLTDFGLAKSSIKREMTSPGVVFGRYSYLSPEQARGLPADRRTDIYACGIVLWELLTGRQLFPSSNRSHQEALDAVRNPRPQAPSSLVPGIPQGLDAVVVRALERDRDSRFPDAGEFRAALSDILARNFPSCDADRASEFMREIFERESKIEQRDYTHYSQQRFSELRATADDSELISIGDAIDADQSVNIALDDSELIGGEEAATKKAPPPRNVRESARAWVGRVIAGRYRIDALIGNGGIGAVFRATHLGLDKVVALKVLYDTYTRDTDAVARFMREARMASRTGHPNIIDVLDIGDHEGGEIYFVMELLEGKNLGELIRDEGRLAVRRAVHIARQICRGLSAAHEAGVVHRDLKAENIVLTKRGRDPDFVKILDFGICKQMNAEGSTSAPGLVMGSPGYMAPEQGAGLEATAASDIYAIASILFEMLTGRVPFIGRNAVDVLMQKGAHEAPRVDEFRPEVPSALTAVVARCLKRHGTDRPPSTRALEYELTRAVDGRATAVATVLGGGTDMDPEIRTGDSRDEISPTASASMQRAAIASLETPPLVAPEQDFTDSSASKLRNDAFGGISIRPRRRWVAGLRAVSFVLLGVLLAAVAFLVLSPEIMQRIDGVLGGTEGPSERRAQQLPDLPRSDPPAVVEPYGPPQIVPNVGDAEILPLGPTQPESLADAITTWVDIANTALAEGEYTEPYDRALATAIARLEFLDPGNGAIGRLRREAAAKLLPLGSEFGKQGAFADAASRYRDLRRIWPDHPTVKTLLVEALLEVSKQQRQERQFAEALATADELLNLEPEDFSVLLLKADMLWYLQRWSECGDAYAVAKKRNRRSRFAAKRYRKCRAKAPRDKG